MEKSIEYIWKQGFLHTDALIAPKLNNLHTQKSIHIIETFKRMFKINLIAICVFSILFLIISYFLGIPIMGIILLISLTVLVGINYRLMKDLERIDNGESSYQYLKAFKEWIHRQVQTNKNISSILYPIIFLSILFGLWFKVVNGVLLGDIFVQKLLQFYPDSVLILGIPLLFLLGVILLISLFAFFGGRIYLWDVNLIYGRVFKKLEDLLSDIEKLTE